MDTSLISGLLGFIVGLMTLLYTLRQKDAEIAALRSEAERKRILELRTGLYLPIVSAFGEMTRLLVMIPLTSSEKLSQFELSTASTQALYHKDIIAGTGAFAAISSAMLQLLHSTRLLRIGRRDLELVQTQVANLLRKQSGFEALRHQISKKSNHEQSDLALTMLNRLETLSRSNDEQLELLINEEKRLFSDLVSQSMAEVAALQSKYFEAVSEIRRELEVESIPKDLIRAHLDAIAIEARPAAEFHVDIREE